MQTTQIVQMLTLGNRTCPVTEMSSRYVRIHCLCVTLAVDLTMGADAPLADTLAVPLSAAALPSIRATPIAAAFGPAL